MIRRIICRLRGHRWRYYSTSHEHGKLWRCERCGMVSSEGAGFVGYR